jgi:hypothetical protein
MDAIRNLFLNKNSNDNTTSWDPNSHRASTNRPDQNFTQNFTSFSESKTYEQNGTTVTETTWTNENGKVTETRKTYNLDPENSNQGNLGDQPPVNDLILGGHSLLGMLGRAEDDFERVFTQMENEMNQAMSSTMPIFIEFGNRAHDLHSHLIEREIRFTQTILNRTNYILEESIQTMNPLAEEATLSAIISSLLRSHGVTPLLKLQSRHLHSILNLPFPILRKNLKIACPSFRKVFRIIYYCFHF